MCECNRIPSCRKERTGQRWGSKSIVSGISLILWELNDPSWFLSYFMNMLRELGFNLLEGFSRCKRYAVHLMGNEWVFLICLSNLIPNETNTILSFLFHRKRQLIFPKRWRQQEEFKLVLEEVTAKFTDPAVVEVTKSTHTSIPLLSYCAFHFLPTG